MPTPLSWTEIRHHGTPSSSIHALLLGRDDDLGRPVRMPVLRRVVDEVLQHLVEERRVALHHRQLPDADIDTVEANPQCFEHVMGDSRE